VASSARTRSGGSALIFALLSGILLAFSFPKFGHPVFAWIALVPLLVALFARQRDPGARFQPRPPFIAGLLTGIGYFGGTVYWTGTTIRTFGGLSWPVAALAASLLIAYLALFPGVFALALAWLHSRYGRRAMLLAPAVWVTTELGRTYFWSGFPWLLLGYSQTTVLPIAQVASVVGVFGLSALVVLVSAALAHFVVDRSRSSIAVLVCVAAFVAGIAVWGSARLRQNTLVTTGSTVRVALIQGNIPQDEKWNAARARQIFETYLALTRDAARQGAKLVIWPESSTPFYFEEDQLAGERIRQLARDTGIELLFGSDQMEHSTPPAYYNSAFLMRPDGSTAAVYRKMHLVPFGEFVPLKRLLFFVGPLVESAGDFSAGRSMVLLPSRLGSVSTAICYEIVYPGLVRDAVLAGSQLLTTITNDAWYGHSSAPYQHFLQASMRSIEQGRYLARSANTGISGFVDPYGRVVQQSRIFERTIILGDVRMLGDLTVYGRIGDLCAYVCAALTALALLLTFFRHGTL
jgi:apolipoprotein N-acyltransferase